MDHPRRRHRLRTRTSERFNSTGTTLQFTLTPSIGITPTWNIVRSGGRKFDGVLGVGFQREYDNKLDVAFTQAARPQGPTKVQIVRGPPDVRTQRLQYYMETPPADLQRLPSGEVDPETQYRLDRTLDTLKYNGLRVLE